MNFWKTYLHSIPKIVLGKDSIGNTLSLHKTIWINFRCLKFKDACKLPIWVYKYTKFNSVGKIKIVAEKIQSGLIRIGSIGNASREHTIIENSGIIIFKGSTSIFRGCYIYNRGNIIFQGKNLLSEGCTLKILDSLEIGEMSILGSETYIIDTDFHFSIDTKTGIIKNNTKGIKIGPYNWFGTKTFVKKGVRTGYGMVTAAAYTVLTKDYSTLDNFTVVGGNPAKPIAKGLRGIFNESADKELIAYFKENPDAEIKIKRREQDNLDKYCSFKDILP